jgi:hypothetical protein
MKSKLRYGDQVSLCSIRAISCRSVISSVMLTATLANTKDLIVLCVQMKGTKFHHLQI